MYKEETIKEKLVNKGFKPEEISQVYEDVSKIITQKIAENSLSLLSSEEKIILRNCKDEEQIKKFMSEKQNEGKISLPSKETVTQIYNSTWDEYFEAIN